jgi:hypothetical protein
MSTHNYNINSYNVTISNNSNNIYLNLTNNVTNQSYEGTFYKNDILSFMEIENYYEFIKKCFEQKTNYSINFEISESKLILQFVSIIEVFTIKHKLILREVTLSNKIYELNYKLEQLKIENTKLKEINLNIEKEMKDNLILLKIENNKLQEQINEILNEQILITDLVSVNKYTTNLDLSGCLNKNIIWSNVIKLPKLKKLIINDTEPPQYGDSFLMMQVLSCKHLFSKRLEAVYIDARESIICNCNNRTTRPNGFYGLVSESLNINCSNFYTHLMKNNGMEPQRKIEITFI